MVEVNQGMTSRHIPQGRSGRTACPQLQLLGEANCEHSQAVRRWRAAVHGRGRKNQSCVFFLISQMSASLPNPTRTEFSCSLCHTGFFFGLCRWNLGTGLSCLLSSFLTRWQVSREQQVVLPTPYMLPVIEQVPANTVEWMSQVNKTHRRKRKGNDKHVDKVSHTERTGTESKKPPLGMSFMRPVPRLPPSNSTPKSWKGTSSNYLPRILHTAKACQICTQSINCILCEKKELQ